MILQEEIFEKAHYDIIVAGGGVGGAAAAVQAAREGKRVLLVEKSQKLGGLATLGLVNFFVPMCNGRGKQIIFGMAEEMLRLSIKYGYGGVDPAFENGRIPEEKMENGCISVCNHVHKLDCVMLACVFQDYTMQFLSLESNLHIPVAGAIVRLMGGIGLPAKLDGWRPVLKRIKQGLDEGQMLQIYPEGELNDGCRTLRAFQPGAFQIACWFRKPMIPCLLRFYPRFSKSGRRKRDGMELVILEPVDIPTDKKGKRAATELETQIRCQMEAARLAVGREGA